MSRFAPRGGDWPLLLAGAAAGALAVPFGSPLGALTVTLGALGFLLGAGLGLFVLGVSMRGIAPRLPTRRQARAAVVLAALVFAGAHLPAWAAVVPLAPALVGAVFALNALGGLLFGALFLEWGIAPATLAPAGADAVFRLLGPALR